MKKTKKVILIMVIFCLLFSAAIPVFAANSPFGINSGDITWLFDPSNGLLTIFGSGEMEDYNSSENYFAPWSLLEIKKVVIQNGVTRIGQEAFSFCDEIVQIQIPDSVLSIGYYAFYECSSLSVITIPDSVVYIEHEAFYNCRSLKSIVIPDSVTFVDSFDGCTSLENVLLSKNLTEMPTFEGCSNLKKVNIPEKINYISRQCFKDCTSLKTVSIPDSVITIGMGVFENTSIYNDENNWEDDVLYIDNHLIKAKTTLSGSYRVKNGTKSIAYYAFEGCTELTDIKIPNGVFSVGLKAFYDTAFYDNQNNWDGDVLYSGNYLIAAKETISGSYNIKSGTKIIAAGAFLWCENLTGVTIPESVENIGLAAFIACKGIKKIEIPNSVINIERAAFSSCTSLEKINIPSKITRINCNTFSQCPNLKKITIHNKVTEIGNFAFAFSGFENIIIPKSVKIIEYDAFSYCENLKSVTLTSDITSFAGNAFNNCANLDTVIFNGSEIEWVKLKLKMRNDSSLRSASVKIEASQKGGTTGSEEETTAKTAQAEKIGCKSNFFASGTVIILFTAVLSFYLFRKRIYKI